MIDEKQLQTLFDELRNDPGKKYLARPKVSRPDPQPSPPAEFYQLSPDQKNDVRERLRRGAPETKEYVNKGRAFRVTLVREDGVPGFQIQSAPLPPTEPLIGAAPTAAPTELAAPPALAEPEPAATIFAVPMPVAPAPVTLTVDPLPRVPVARWLLFGAAAALILGAVMLAVGASAPDDRPAPGLRPGLPPVADPAGADPAAPVGAESGRLDLYQMFARERAHTDLWHAAHYAKLNAQGDTLLTLTSNTNEHARSLGARIDKLTRLEADLKKLEKQLVESEAKIQPLKQAVQDRDKELKSVRQQLADKEREVKSQDDMKKMVKEAMQAEIKEVAKKLKGKASVICGAWTWETDIKFSFDPQ